MTNSSGRAPRGSCGAGRVLLLTDKDKRMFTTFVYMFYGLLHVGYFTTKTILE